MYKLPIEFVQGNLTAKVSNKNRHGEYVVKFYENGKHLKDADYFTADKDDAISTAKVELKRMNEVNNRPVFKDEEVISKTVVLAQVSLKLKTDVIKHIQATIQNSVESNLYGRKENGFIIFEVDE